MQGNIQSGHSQKSDQPGHSWERGHGKIYWPDGFRQLRAERPVSNQKDMVRKNTVSICRDRRSATQSRLISKDSVPDVNFTVIACGVHQMNTPGVLPSLTKDGHRNKNQCKSNAICDSVV